MVSSESSHALDDKVIILNLHISTSNLLPVAVNKTIRMYRIEI